MSIEATIGRVGELHTLLAARTPAVAQPQATSFAAALASASGATGESDATGAASAAQAALGASDISGLLASALSGSVATSGALPATFASAGTATVSALPAGTPYGAEITAAARANGVDPALLAGLVKQESGFDPSAGSSAGARGLTQLMPGTAASLGVTNVLDPVQSLAGGARYLRRQLDTFGGDVTKALAAYNAGPGAVQRFGGVPPYAETQGYVRAVQANAATFRAGAISET